MQCLRQTSAEPGSLVFTTDVCIGSCSRMFMTCVEPCSVMFVTGVYKAM